MVKLSVEYTQTDCHFITAENSLFKISKVQIGKIIFIEIIINPEAAC